MEYSKKNIYIYNIYIGEITRKNLVLYYYYLLCNDNVIVSCVGEIN